MTSGNDIDDAMTMARNVLRIRLEHIIREGEPLPVPSTFEEARSKTLELTKNCPDCGRGSFFSADRRARYGQDSGQHIAVAAAQCVQALDRKAALAGMTLEGYLTSLALS